MACHLVAVALSVVSVAVAATAGAGTDRRKARASTPDERRAAEHHASGRRLLRLERFDEAVSELRRAVRLDPKLILAHYDLGRAHMALRDYGNAVAAYADCREAYRALAADLVAGSMRAQEARDERILELQDRIRELQRRPVNPNSAAGHAIQGEIGQIEGMISHLRSLRGQDRHSTETPAELSLALGSAYFRSGSLQDAEREYRAAVAARPGLGEAHSNLAVVYLMLGRPDEALESVRRAEAAGFRVHPDLKRDIEAARGGPPR